MIARPRPGKGRPGLFGDTMKITKVNIQNFRSIKELELTPASYTSLVGPNNAGKSNIIGAILFFYDEIKIKPSDFHCTSENTCSEINVEIEFKLFSDDLFDSLPDQYKLPGKRLKVRRSLISGSKASYKGYTFVNGNEELHDADFFGAKGVGKSKLGTVIYVPALKDVSDELRTTGTATLGKLLGEIIQPALAESQEYEAFTSSVGKLSEKLKGQASTNRDEWTYKSTSEIEAYLTKELSSWDCAVKLDLVPLDPSKLVQQSAEVKIEEANHMALPVASKGHGLQRSLEIAMVKLWAEVVRKREQEQLGEATKKLFKPDYSLLLIEEPESFQHPQQQLKFFEDLRGIASNPNQQVITTTHSPIFLTPHCEDLSSVVKVIKQGNLTNTIVLSKSFLTTLASEEVQRSFRHHLWLNPDRNFIFFVALVILVEGTTERVLYKWLLENSPDITNEVRRQIFIMDCGGKFTMDLTMKLLAEFKIYHIVVHDIDNEKKPMHQAANQKIQAAENDFTVDILKIVPDIETRLKVQRTSRGSEKPVMMLEYLNDPSMRNEAEIDKLRSDIVASIKKTPGI